MKSTDPKKKKILKRGDKINEEQSSVFDLITSKVEYTCFCEYSSCGHVFLFFSIL